VQVLCVAAGYVKSSWDLARKSAEELGLGAERAGAGCA
jgi:hypothetical protein